MSQSNTMRSSLPQGQSGKLSTLLHAEDWWSVWFGSILILSAAYGLLTAVPKPGRWSVYPLDAFIVLSRHLAQPVARRGGNPALKMFGDCNGACQPSRHPKSR